MELIVREWLDTINSLPPNLKFIQPSEMAKELVPKLREQGADIIVALTHMVRSSVTILIQREPNDVLLAKSVPEGLIDIILGGHDHYVVSLKSRLTSSTTIKRLTAFQSFVQVQISDNSPISKLAVSPQSNGHSQSNDATYPPPFPKIQRLKQWYQVYPTPFKTDSKNQ